MRSGGIGVVTTPNGSAEINTSEYPRTRTEGDHQLRSSVDVEWGQAELNGATLYRGRTARETLADNQTIRISDDGRIETGQKSTDVVTHATDFLRVPGDFVVTESTEDDFAHELLEDATGEAIRPGNIDLESFADNHPDAELWMGWFRSSNSPVDAGAAYGEINRVPDLAKFVHKNENSQLGLENLEYNGRRLKLVLSESGWVAVYEPSDMDAVEFARFIREEVFPHTTPDV